MSPGFIKQTIISRGGVVINMYKKLALYWHTFKYNSNTTSFQDCLDCKMKEKIKNNIDYHISKIHELKQLN